jgi:hypothetical protein
MQCEGHDEINKRRCPNISAVVLCEEHALQYNWPYFLDNFPPSKYSTRKGSHTLYYGVFVLNRATIGREEVTEYIKKYSPMHNYISFMVDILIQNSYVTYNLRNRSLIDVHLFANIVEGLFAKFYVNNDIRYVKYAISIGISPIFVFNMVRPYFYRILNNTMHNRTGQDVFDTIPTMKYRLSFTGLNARYVPLLEMVEFMTALAFVNADLIKNGLNEIFSSFQHFGLEVFSLEEMKARLCDEFLIGRLKYRDQIRDRVAALKKELIEHVYNPDRVWRVSQRLGILPWDFMDN